MRGAPGCCAVMPTSGDVSSPSWSIAPPEAMWGTPPPRFIRARNGRAAAIVAPPASAPVAAAAVVATSAPASAAVAPPAAAALSASPAAAAGAAVEAAVVPAAAPAAGAAVAVVGPIVANDASAPALPRLPAAAVGIAVAAPAGRGRKDIVCLERVARVTNPSLYLAHRRSANARTLRRRSGRPLDGPHDAGHPGHPERTTHRHVGDFAARGHRRDGAAARWAGRRDRRVQSARHRELSDPRTAALAALLPNIPA